MYVCMCVYECDTCMCISGTLVCVPYDSVRESKYSNRKKGYGISHVKCMFHYIL